MMNRTRPCDAISIERPPFSTAPLTWLFLFLPFPFWLDWLALVAGCTASAVAAILALGVCFYRWVGFLTKHSIVGICPVAWTCWTPWEHQTRIQPAISKRHVTFDQQDKDETFATWNRPFTKWNCVKWIKWMTRRDAIAFSQKIR